MGVRFDDYVTSQVAGFKDGVGDVTRSAIADVGDTYQEILMADANISPPDGWTQTMESVSYEMERDPPDTPALEADPVPEPTPDIEVER